MEPYLGDAVMTTSIGRDEIGGRSLDNAFEQLLPLTELEEIRDGSIFAPNAGSHASYS